MNIETDPMVLIMSSEYYNPEHDHEAAYTHQQQQQQFVPLPEQQEAGKARRRRRKKEGGGSGMMRKRKLSDAQVSMLERSFGSEHKLESERKDRLAAELGLDPRQVAVWFQNRRARWKTKKLELEYSKLKADHDNAVLDKCRLHTEVMKLKEELDEAEKKIKRLSERSDGFSSNSPTSSSNFSMVDPPNFFGDFGLEGLENVINCMPPPEDEDNNNFYDQWGTLNYTYM